MGVTTSRRDQQVTQTNDGDVPKSSQTIVAHLYF